MLLKPHITFCSEKENELLGSLRVSLNKRKMVGKTPLKQKKMDPALNSTLIRQTVQKVDRCIVRLQELQFTITGKKLISATCLSPRRTRGYKKVSLRCKEESLRMRNRTSMISPPPPIGKFSPNRKGEWKRMSLPAMILGETIEEILQATRFTRQTFPPNTKIEDPKTPLTQSNNHSLKYTDLGARRRREKHQQRSGSIQSQNPDSPTRRRARSRINFKASPSPTDKKEENGTRASPRNEILFHPMASSNQLRFCKTGSPVGTQQPPHKFLIKTPISNSIRGMKIIRSPTRSTAKKQSRNRSPMASSAASKLKICISPARLAYKLASPLKNTRCGWKPPTALIPPQRKI